MLCRYSALCLIFASTPCWAQPVAVDALPAEPAEARPPPESATDINAGPASVVINVFAGSGTSGTHAGSDQAEDLGENIGAENLQNSLAPGLPSRDEGGPGGQGRPSSGRQVGPVQIRARNSIKTGSGRGGSAEANIHYVDNRVIYFCPPPPPPASANAAPR